MTQPIANCPNCGAKITFRWSSSVQTVCEYCKSILVRTDIDLKKVGQVAASRTPLLIKDSAPQNDWILRAEWADREQIR